MRTFRLSCLLGTLFVFIITSCQDGNKIRPDHKQKKESIKQRDKREDFKGAYEYWKATSSDIETGLIPYDKLLDAISIGKKRLQDKSNERSMPGSITDPKWIERGPSNIGGRTRAIMIDKDHRNRVWIGSVSGGLYRTEDITQQDPQWVELGNELNNLSIGAIAQDPNNRNTIYVGTGEGYNNADAVSGTGIFRSFDDGQNWEWVASTKTNNFVNVYELYIHTNGHIYAATENGGVQRSIDGGTTWLKVLGTSLSGASSNTMYDFKYVAANQTFYASNTNSIFKSITGDRGDWTNIGLPANGFPTNLERVEFAVCESNPDFIYCIGNINSFSSETIASSDGGQTWVERSTPPIFGEYGQAWYDLELAVDPFDCGHLIAGGVPLAESESGGEFWRELENDVHVDQHNILFDPLINGRVFFGNDGGIWLSEDGGETAPSRSFKYVSTQFYCCAIHPHAGSPYLLGGLQDNGSQILEQHGLSTARRASGADGVFCFIDQLDPNIQITSHQYGDYNLSLDGGGDFDDGPDIDGSFVNVSAYDSRAKILYGQVNGGGGSDVDFFRWNIMTSQVDEVDISNLNVNVTAALVDPLVPNRIYLGGPSGQVVVVENADQGLSLTGQVYADLPGSSSVSCVYKDKTSDADVLVSIYNFGASLENIFVTYNSGQDWTSIEGDLPDLPVRWAVFDPADHDKAMIATDAGVWMTDDIDGDSTHWVPSAPANGMPFVRVTRLELRDSDKVLLAGTYGRGLLTTDVFTTSAPVISVKPLSYVFKPIIIDGTQSLNTQSYEWDLGDGNFSTEPLVNHVYTQPGTYTITLKINGTKTTTKQISILPYLPTPYQSGHTLEWSGHFENRPEYFAAQTISGTPFQRGLSNIQGKDGSHSGVISWVTGYDEAVYENETHAELYTPMFDMSANTLYEFRFRSKHALAAPNDGFQVEYTLDAGESWQQLGDATTGWYNFKNTDQVTSAFPVGKSYFTGIQNEWKQYAVDASSLSGHAQVSFRFVFRSNALDQAAGIAIDDVELTKFEGELKTAVTSFTGEFIGDQDIKLTWATGVEYQCRKFHIERSYSGFSFEEIAQINPAGIVSITPHTYTYTDHSLHDLIFYRIRVVNENALLPYEYEFYTETILVRRDVKLDLVQHVVPTLFDDKILIAFSEVVITPIVTRLYDVSGKLVFENEATPNAFIYAIENLHLPQGVYILSIESEGQEDKIVKVFTMGGG